MKKSNVMTVAMMAAVMMTATMMTGCSKDALGDADTTNHPQGVKTLTLMCQGDFTMTTEAMTRGAMDADGKAMTDLWVLDYVDGELVQQVHQASTEEGFGSPSLTLSFGTHHVYIVASRGKEAVLSTDSHKLTWGTPSDTFYKDYVITVSSGTSSSQTVTLDRVVTKLTVTINDALPEGLNTILLTPTNWNYGVDYLTGLPTEAKAQEPITITIPNSYAGRTNINLNVFGLSGATEWTTDVTVTACGGDNATLGYVALTAAPFKANRVTSYSGSLFASAGGFSISLDSDWEDAFKSQW